MKYNKITYKVFGRNAMFADPITKLGGELCTYHVPTYEALRGITEAIYWKPSIEWVIDRVKIIKPIQTESKNIKLRNLDDEGVGLYRYTYLHDTEYIVEAHFEWNKDRPDLADDFDERKHSNIAKRYLKKGGKRDLFLGKRECVAYVKECEFDSEESYYKDRNEIDFGIMFHSFIYPSESSNKLIANLSHIVMKNGVIEFERPDECKISRVVREMEYSKTKIGSDFVDEEIAKEGDE